MTPSRTRSAPQSGRADLIRQIAAAASPKRRLALPTDALRRQLLTRQSKKRDVEHREFSGLGFSVRGHAAGNETNNRLRGGGTGHRR